MNVMKKRRFSLVLNLCWAATLGLIATTGVGRAAGTVVGWGNNWYGHSPCRHLALWAGQANQGS